MYISRRCAGNSAKRMLRPSHSVEGKTIPNDLMISSFSCNYNSFKGKNSSFYLSLRKMFSKVTLMFHVLPKGAK